MSIRLGQKAMAVTGLGQKAMESAGLGQKNIHSAAAISAKALGFASAVSPLVALAAPEIGIPMGVGASAGYQAARGLEKLTRKDRPV